MVQRAVGNCATGAGSRLTVEQAGQSARGSANRLSIPLRPVYILMGCSVWNHPKATRVSDLSCRAVASIHDIGERFQPRERCCWLSPPPAALAADDPETEDAANAAEAFQKYASEVAAGYNIRQSAPKGASLCCATSRCSAGRTRYDAPGHTASCSFGPTTGDRPPSSRSISSPARTSFTSTMSSALCHWRACSPPVRGSRPGLRTKPDLS